MEPDNTIIKDPDAKDRAILRELFNNARSPYSVIAKKVRLSEESVNYRIKRMIDQGLVTGFNTIIDVKKIGFQIFFIYLKLRNIDINYEEKIIQHLKNDQNVAWIIKCLGNYDFIIKIFAKSIDEANLMTKKLESKFSTHIDLLFIDALIEEKAIPFSFLYETKETEFYSIKSSSNIEIDNTDIKILKSIANNARLSTTELAINLKQSRELIKYRLKKLEENKIITKYRPDVWPKKIGYNWYFLIFKIGFIDKEISSKLQTYVTNHPNVTYFYKTIGSSDIQIEVRMKTTLELNNTLMKIRGILKDSLKHHDVQIILQEYKYTYFPDCLSV